ncbi:IS256 family transposase [Acetobacterium bakii]|uniref:Mutator family transposase n=1 Tax=Acetobacterium bakii TaxID=52689 RepID=A0A0L6U562_9FIRM|nr:IS256 family transposase [Acetobacterium bakii]KNZ43462.1 transposase [Acetobacterium bakii]
MGRRDESPEKKRRRVLIGEFLKENPIKDGSDINDLVKELIAQVVENSLEGELDDELGYTKYDYRNKETDNSRNGYSKKTVHSSFGDMPIDVPRDRKGEFEPQLIQKNQNTLTQDIESKIISMYAKGMSTGDFEDHVKDLYGLDISDSTISRITDKVLPLVKEWQSRPLEEIYAVVFLDAIHFHVRSEGRIIKKAVYIAIGINMEGYRDVLGMWVGENESAKFWLSVMNDIKNRGVEDILIASVDGLTGFPEAIAAVYPKTELQKCVIHQIRNTTRFVSYKDLRPLMADLKRVYTASTEETALYELDAFEEKWHAKYPKIAVSWRDNWAHLATYFKYPQEVRTLIYTTNLIERFNRQMRKVTKSKVVFPTDDSLMKMLYLAMIEVTKKWTQSRRDWGKIHSQLEIYFADRLD